jgi:hypothetical protein
VTDSGVLTVPGNLVVTTTSGDVVLDTATNTFTGTIALTVPAAANVTLVDTTAVALPALTVASLSVTAGGAITQTGDLAVTGLGSFKTLNNSGAAITVANAGNAFGSVGAQVRNLADNADATANISVGESGGTVVAGLRTGGNLTALATNGGALTQTGSMVVGGTTSVTAGAAPITLANTGNDFTGAVSLSNSGGNAVSVTDTNAIKLGTVSVGTGTLTITANAGGSPDTSGITQLAGTTITQSAGAGSASFLGGAGAIDLSNTNNNFTGSVAVTNSGTNNVTVRDETGGIALGTSTVGQNLTVISAGGNITQPATNTLTVPGILRLIAGAFDITLDENNSLNRLVIESATNATVRSSGALSFGDNTGNATGTSTIGAIYTIEP